MRAVVQRVSRGAVTIDGDVTGRVGHGLVVFVGVAAGDGPADMEYIASKICELRIFGDARGRMNRSVVDAGGGLLVVSQFTLLGDARRGRRPAFDGAESPDAARRLYEALVARLATTGLPLATGRFQAHMEVDLVNDGPVTILLDSRRQF